MPVEIALATIFEYLKRRRETLQWDPVGACMNKNAQEEYLSCKQEIRSEIYNSTYK